jgi:hypothetical protein
VLLILGLLKVDGKVIDCKAVHPENAAPNVPIVSKYCGKTT